ncbi:MAG: polysaccharide lyase [Hyphomicrobiaceae bacterium]
MIVRQRNSAASTRLLFNLGGGIVVLLTAALAWKWSQYKPAMPTCEQRYASGVLFSLARGSGALLSIDDLKARLEDNDWGLGTNARIKTTGSRQVPVALEIDLRADKASPSSPSERRSGIGFNWYSPSLETAASACLSYSVWVPEDFDYGSGGRLPGLTGGRPDGGETIAASMARRFFTRVSWRHDRSLSVTPGSQDGQLGDAARIADGNVRLSPGRWTRIEQEVILNTPDNRDGILRVWVDGVLGLELRDVAWRGSVDQRWLGVNADAYYARAGRDWVSAPRDTSIRISPLELRVQ